MDHQYRIIDVIKKIGVIVYYVEMMTPKLPDLPEEYHNIVENIEDKLDYDIDYILIKRICDKVLEKYDQINV